MRSVLWLSCGMPTCDARRPVRMTREIRFPTGEVARSSPAGDFTLDFDCLMKGPRTLRALDASSVCCRSPERHGPRLEHRRHCCAPTVHLSAEAMVPHGLSAARSPYQSPAQSVATLTSGHHHAEEVGRTYDALRSHSSVSLEGKGAVRSQYLVRNESWKVAHPLVKILKNGKNVSWRTRTSHLLENY